MRHPLHSLHGFQANVTHNQISQGSQKGIHRISHVDSCRTTCRQAFLWNTRCGVTDGTQTEKALCPEMMDALLSIIFSSPPSSSSSSSSSGFQRSRAAKLGSLARSTARSASIRAVDSSFCFCSVASRCARTRASSGRYSLCAKSCKSNDQ